MKRLALNAILRLGRYAILPIVALACSIFIVWLTAIDRYTVVTLATAPVVLSTVMAATVLALGLLLLPARRDRNIALDEEAAPGLWAIWKELDGAFARSNRTLRIDTQFNASIREESRYAGLFKQHVTMTVGLPLLIILDERAIRAIIAHEVAHARLRHASGGTKLLDFIAASENVLYYADPDRTVTGRIARALLHSMLEWLEREYRALSRENELCADQGAADLVGRDEVARALVLVEACGARLTDLVFTPLEKELLGAIKVPPPPFERIFNHLADIRASDPAAAALAGPSCEQDPDSTHPPLEKRLTNLGFTDVPSIDSVAMSSVDQLLSRHTVKELTARFDKEWRKNAQQRVRVGS